MRVTPPPVEGYGISPFININPVEAKLRLTFTRPTIDDSFKFYTGDSREINAYLNETLDEMTVMIPQPATEGAITYSITGTDENDDLEYTVSSNLAFDWRTQYALGAVVLGHTLVDRIVSHIANPDYELFTSWYVGNRSSDFNMTNDQFMSFIRPDGSALIPFGFSGIDNEEAVDYVEEVEFVIGVVKASGIEVFRKDVFAKFHNNIVNPVSVNQAQPMPFVIGNLLQGRTPEQVFVEVCIVVPLNSPLFFTSNLATLNADVLESVTGLDVNIVYDDVADTITVEGIGGPHAVISIGAIEDGVLPPYSNVTLPVDSISTLSTYKEYDYEQAREGVFVEVTRTKNIIALPHVLDGSIIKPDIAWEGELVDLTPAHREKLNTLGRTFSTADNAALNTTITLEGNGNYKVSVDLNTMPTISPISVATAAGYSDSKRRGILMPYVAYKTTNPEIIAGYQRILSTIVLENHNSNHMGFLEHTASWKGNTNNLNMDLILGEFLLVDEAGVPTLYIPIPLTDTISMGTVNRTLKLYLFSGAYNDVATKSIETTLNYTLTEPLVSVSQALEGVKLNVTSLFGNAVYDCITHTVRTGQIVDYPYDASNIWIGGNSETTWSNETEDDLSYSAIDNVKLRVNLDGEIASFLSYKGGNNRPSAALTMTLVMGVVIPPEFSTAGTGFNVIQLDGAVAIITKFDALALPYTELPFTALTSIYQMVNGNETLVKTDVTTDTTMLPFSAPVNGNLVLKYTPPLPTNPFITNSQIPLNRKYGVGVWILTEQLPVDPADFHFECSIKIAKLWEYIYEYKGVSNT